MGWIAAYNQKKEGLKPSTKIRLGDQLLMKLLVKGKGSPFIKDEKDSAAALNLKEDESKLSLS